MWEEANQKAQKFKIEIRRRQRHEIIQKERQLFQQEERKQRQSKNSIKRADSTSVAISPKIAIGNNIALKQLYAISQNSKDFLEQIGDEQMIPIMEMLLTQESLEQLEGAHLLGTFIQVQKYLGPKMQKKVQYVKRALEPARIEERVLELVMKSMNQMQYKKVKLYLFCLRSMAFTRMQGLLNKALLVKYLPPIVQNFISDTSVLIMLSYISETYSFSPQIIKKVCQQATSKQKLVTLMIICIVNNYTKIEEDSQNLVALFDDIVQTMMHLYMQSKSYEQKYSMYCFNALTVLVSKYPDNLGRELLGRVERSKMQDLMMVILAVSGENTKELVYQLEEAIIDKCIHQLREQFFRRFSLEIVGQFIHGIQHTHLRIIVRCLKVLVKLLHYAPANLTEKMNRDHDLAYVLEDLSYHGNQFVAETAAGLRKGLPESINDGDGGADEYEHEYMGYMSDF